MAVTVTVELTASYLLQCDDVTLMWLATSQIFWHFSQCQYSRVSNSRVLQRSESGVRECQNV